jgi:hypothetical protein
MYVCVCVCVSERERERERERVCVCVFVSYTVIRGRPMRWNTGPMPTKKKISIVSAPVLVLYKTALETTFENHKAHTPREHQYKAKIKINRKKNTPREHQDKTEDDPRLQVQN